MDQKKLKFLENNFFLQNFKIKKGNRKKKSYVNI